MANMDNQDPNKAQNGAAADSKKDTAASPAQKKSNDQAVVSKVAGSESVTRRYVVFILLGAVVLYGANVAWKQYSARKKINNVVVQSSVVKSHKMKGKNVETASIQDKKYAELLLKRESMDADKAARSGRSSIPSVLSSKVAANDFGRQGMLKSTKKPTKKPVSFADISKECDKEKLFNARKAGVLASELKCKGCDAKHLKAAGYSAGALYESGYSASAMKKAGYGIHDLVEAGYDLSKLRAADFPLTGPNSIQSVASSVGVLKKEGFSAKDMKQMGLNGLALRKVCFSVESLLKAGYSTKDILQMGYLPVELSRHGVSVNALRNAGVAEKDLKAAGLLAMRYGKCDVVQMRKSHSKGIKASQWLAKGCNPMDLKKSGYSLGELLDADLGIPEIAKLGFSAKAMAGAGIPVAKLRQAGVPLKQLKVRYGYSLSDLKKAGYYACDFKKAGLDPTSLRLAGFDARHLLQAGYDAEELKKAGFPVGQLLSAGALLRDLLGAGYSIAELKKAGVSAKALKLAGVSAMDAKAAGYTSHDLASVGYGYGDLVRAGYSSGELEKAGLQNTEKKGCGREFIRHKRKQGVSLMYFKDKGCSVSSLHHGGYSWSDLKRAGYGAQMLKLAGATLNDLKSLFDTDDLFDAGFSRQDLLSAGINVEDSGLHAVGHLSCDRHSIKEGVKQGVSARSFLLKGCGPAALKAGGYSMTDLRHAGFGILALKDAGFSDKDILSAGFSQRDLATKGMGSKKLNDALEHQISAGQAPPVSQEALLRQQMEDRFGKMTQQQKEQAVKKMQNSMKSEAKKLMNSWQKPTKMSGKAMKQSDVIAVLPAAHGYGAAANGDGTGGKSRDSNQDITYGKSSDTKGKSPHDSMIKAGSISYAVIDNAVSSDSKSPVLATVVEGPLQGSKLIGSFSTSKDKMMIKFTKISVPWRDQSASINVMAIDPDTAEGALASRVDHHYWKKYGVLFAASFVQGLGNAVNNASTTVSSSIGTYTFQTAGLTLTEKVLSALGQVGTSVGSDVKSISNDVKTTVIVDSGTNIGLLFVDDYMIPQ